MKKPFDIKRGYRTIGDRKIWFKSRMEANYARYLQFLLKQGEIRKWDYEPDTFEFKKIKRGTRFYLPDFRIIENNGKVRYIETKGYRHQQGETALKRMARYYPDIELDVVSYERYKVLSRQVRSLIKDWEV